MNFVSLYGRLAFPHILEPHAAVEGGTPKYDAILLVDPNSDVEDQKAQVTDYLKACLEVATAKLGTADAAKAALKARPVWKKGDDRENPPEGFAGMVYLTASSKRKPKYYDAETHEIDAAAANEVFYPGCYVQILVQPWAYNRNGNRGVSHELLGIRFCGDAPSFSGRPTITPDAFKPLKGAPAQPEPSAGDVNDLL